MQRYFSRIIWLCAVICVASGPLGCDRSSKQQSEGDRSNTSSSSSETTPSDQSESEDQDKTDSGDDTPKGGMSDEAVDSRGGGEADVGLDSTSADQSAVPMISLESLPADRRPQFEFAQQQVKENPESADLVTELGLHYLAFQFNEEAVQCFTFAIERLPKAMRFWYLRALAYDAAGKPLLAQADYEKSITLDPEYVAAYVNLGKLLLAIDATQAAAIFEEATKRDESDAIGWWGRGHAAMKLGQLDEAIQFLDRAVSIQADFADAHADLAEIYESQNKSDLAQVHRDLAQRGTKPLVKNDPLAYQIIRRTRDQDSIAAEAVSLARQGESLKAARYLETALFNGIDSGSIRLALGGIYLDTGRPIEAIGQFKTGLEAEPESTELKLALARAYAQAELFPQSEALYNELVAANQDDAKPLVQRARMYAGTQDYEKALTDLRAARKLAPDDYQIAFDQIELLMLTGAIDEAETELAKVPNKADTQARKLLFEGGLALRRDRIEAGEAKFRQALDIDPTLAIAYMGLAQSIQRRGNTRAALEVLLTGISKVPGAAELKNNAAWILATSKDAGLRDGKLALQLAQSACQLTGNRRHNFLGTLAAAYAEAGEFEQAARAAERAAQLARSAGFSDAADAHRARQEGYESRSPYRQ